MRKMEQIVVVLSMDDPEFPNGELERRNREKGKLHLGEKEERMRMRFVSKRHYISTR